MQNETICKRLIYRSWHRGTREMDLLMGSFADRHVPEFSDAELEQYEILLNVADPDLYDWIIGRADAPANYAGPVLDRLMSHQFAHEA
jgi:antitoxin CptB